MCQEKIFKFEKVFWILYNLFIDEKERHMADNDFFRMDQETWYTEFVDTEVSEILSDTIAHREIFEFDDVPF